MAWDSPNDVMPWVGLYVAIASFVCTLAMAADAIHGFWHWKLWFPNKFFTLNASTLTLIAIAMKLPVDLSTAESIGGEIACDGNIVFVKMMGTFFLVTMLANFLPSFGLMDDRELLANIVALVISVTTIAVNVGIQASTSNNTALAIALYIFISAYPWPLSVALTVSSLRKKLEYRYKESQGLFSSYQEKRFSSKGLRSYVKKYWMMTETRNPQFVIACSPVSSAFGVLCSIISFLALSLLVLITDPYFDCINTDYKWSIKVIYIVQAVGCLVGNIAPIFRCLSCVGHHNLSTRWSRNHLNVFHVEKYWNERLQQWKHRHVYSFIPGRHLQIVFHVTKNTFLNICISVHVLVLVICKSISLGPTIVLIVLSYCWRLFKSCLKWCKKVIITPTANESSEIEEYALYVVQIEEDVKLSDRILRNTLNYITQLLIASEKKEPRNLMALLEKSKGFEGVVNFQNERVQPMFEEPTCNYWSLVIVTLTSVAIALPNIAPNLVKSLLSSMREGLQLISHIEECLYKHGDDKDGDVKDGDDGAIEAKKATKRLSTEVEVYRSWLQIDLQKKAREGKTSKEILESLSNDAVKIMVDCMNSKKPGIDQSPYEFIVASSMYRISRSMLLHFSEQETGLSDEEVFDRISTMIADILTACFTNLPRVIKSKCHQKAIEKRGDNIRDAAELLGRSKKILKLLKARQFPDMDPETMPYIDKWREVIINDSQIPYGGASSTTIEQASSSVNEQIKVSIM